MRGPMVGESCKFLWKPEHRAHATWSGCDRSSVLALLTAMPLDASSSFTALV
jgi:hypothetical protein